MAVVDGNAVVWCHDGTVVVAVFRVPGKKKKNTRGCCCCRYGSFLLSLCRWWLLPLSFSRPVVVLRVVGGMTDNDGVVQHHHCQSYHPPSIYTIIVTVNPLLFVVDVLYITYHMTIPFPIIVINHYVPLQASTTTTAATTTDTDSVATTRSSNSNNSEYSFSYQVHEKRPPPGITQRHCPATTAMRAPPP